MPNRTHGQSAQAARRAIRQTDPLWLYARENPDLSQIELCWSRLVLPVGNLAIEKALAEPISVQGLERRLKLPFRISRQVRESALSRRRKPRSGCLP